MSLKKEKQSTEDQYLDLIIKLAFERKAELEIEQLLNEPDPELSEEDEAAADRAFQTAMAEEEEQRRKEKRTQTIFFIRKALLNVSKFAACLIIVVGIAVPIAIATSSQFRSKVMQLLMDIDTVSNEAHFSFVEDENAAFYVPEDWDGEWYVAYIPTDLSLISVQQLMQYVEFSDGNLRKLRFSEMDEEYSAMIGTENTTITNVTIRGQIGWMIVDNGEDHAIAIIWSHENKWFKLSSFNLSQEEMITIAENVRKIKK